MRIFKWIIIVLIFLALVFSLFLFDVPFLSRALDNIAGPFFAQKITTDELRHKYDRGKISVLVVPGHDNISTGGQYKRLQENDLNIELAQYLHEYFLEDENFSVFKTRDRWGNYNSWFLEYLEKEGESVSRFRDSVKKYMSYVLGEGLVERAVKVFHNPAADNVSLNLYAINKWANDNNIDIVIHVHFNDYPTRYYGWPGKYSGFSIYVPESQLPNSEASIDLANNIRGRLEKYFAKSNFPGEADTVVEDQQLIAVGSNASRDGVSVLVEYGYIYEPQIRSNSLRSTTMKEMAFQTFLGTKDFFRKNLSEGDSRPPSQDSGVAGAAISNRTTLLPYKWENVLQKGIKDSLDVLHLQAALHESGFYPPKGKTLSNCPMSGNFGNCTWEAVCEFQKKYDLGCVGVVGPNTLEKLNELY